MKTCSPLPGQTIVNAMGFGHKAIDGRFKQIHNPVGIDPVDARQDRMAVQIHMRKLGFFQIDRSPVYVHNFSEHVMRDDGAIKQRVQPFMVDQLKFHQLFLLSSNPGVFCSIGGRRQEKFWIDVFILEPN